MRLYLILLYFALQSSFAQDLGIKVLYSQYFDTDFPIKRNAVLYANANISLFEDFVKSEGQNTDLNIEEAILSAKNNFTISPKVEFNDFIKIDKRSNQISFFGQLQLEDNYLITDSDVVFEWKITQESKSITGYKSYKAETFFRGRKWIAWFAPELNFSFGPWKLYGLPGLILEAYDETRRYSFSAKQITFVVDHRLYLDFMELRNVKLKESSYKDFLDKQAEIRNNFFVKDKRDSEGTYSRMEIPRKGIELKYEWEE